MSSNDRRFRRTQGDKRKGGDHEDNIQPRGKRNRSGGRPLPEAPDRQEIRRTLNGLRGTNLAEYLEEADLD